MSPRRADSFALGICNGHLAKKLGLCTRRFVVFFILKGFKSKSILELRFKTPPSEQKVFIFFPFFFLQGLLPSLLLLLLSLYNHYYHHAYYHAIYIYIDIYT